jgi:hypothetical protein
MSGWQQSPDEPMRSIPFDHGELDVIRTTAGFMVVAGVLGILKAVLDFVVTGIGSVGAINAPQIAWLPVATNLCGGAITALVALALGAWLIIGARAFKQVIDTDEADQHHLAHGLRQLKNVFLLKSLLILGTIALVCLGMVAGMAVASQY